MIRPVILAALLTLPGCTAVSTVSKIAAAPVKAASIAVDAATVSQSERDEQRGRELRQREERIGELDREYRKQSLACDEGEARACARRDAALSELQVLTASQPYPQE